MAISEPLPEVAGGPEASFLVTPPAVDGGTVTASMPTGPWLTGPSGTPPGGALGVLIDDAIGYALLLDRPPGLWSVSAEIAMDLCRPIPTDGTTLTAEGRNLHTGPGGGLASGTVRDAHGQLIAICRQHGRFVPHRPMAPSASRERPAATAPAADLTELLGVRPQPTEGGARLEFILAAELANPLGNLHGGITLCLCDLLAQTALTALGGAMPTASVHVAYVRALPLGARARFDCAVLHHGRSFAVTRITATNERGQPAVIATVTAGAPS